MKNYRLIFAATALLACLYVQAQGVMIYRGGDFEYYASDDVDSLVFVSEEPKVDLLEGQKYMDLGLPSGTLWATCNIGASSPEQHGWYFAWGETGVKSSYSRENYSVVPVGNTRDLYNEEDVALLTLGGNWRMPTEAEFQELMEQCEWSWEKYRSAQGCRVTGPNGKSIFLPAASFKDNDVLVQVDTAMYGSYWGRTFNATMDETPCGTELTFGIVKTNNHGFDRTSFYYDFGPTGYCHCGRSIRPVYAEPIENPVTDSIQYTDFTGYIQNSSYDDNDYSGWEGTELSGGGPKGNAEHWNKNYDTYQTISGLPAGKYVIGVQGFYRKGSCEEDYDYWLAGDTSHDYAFLYANSSIGAYSVPLVSASIAALTTNLGGDVAGVTNPNDGVFYYLPRNMAAGAYWMEAGYYQNELTVEVGTDGILTIGIKKETLIVNDWTLIDNWTLKRIDE